MKLRPDAPLVLAYHGVFPVLKGPLVASGPGSALLGKVTLGERVELGPFAVLRGDGHAIAVGDDVYIGMHSTVHISHALYGTTIGRRVSVGSNAVVHACTVGDDCVVQDRACVLDGAVVGSGCVVASGSVVFSRAVLPPGFWCEGVPALAVRPIDAAELAQWHLQTRRRSFAVDDACSSYLAAPDAGVASFTAATVTGAGEVRMGAESSLWYSCVIDAGVHGVSIAAGANVQDNSVLRCSERPVEVGEDCTVGHNVLLQDCTIGQRVLVGMGSVLAPHTVVMDDVLLAAGSTTGRGQVLESGWLWGGRPARAIAPLDVRKLQMIKQSAAIYREYMKGFAESQAIAAGPSSR